MTRTLRGLLVAALVAACGDGGGGDEGGVDAGVDGSIDGGGGGPHFRVDTRGEPAPLLAAYDDGSGWAVPAPVEPGVLAVPVADTVSIAIVCAETDSSVGIMVKRLTPVADETVSLPCAARLTQRDTYPVTIIPESGFAVVHNFGLAPGADRTRVTASPGRWDVVASTPGRVLVRRGVEFPPAVPLVLDIERDGADRVPLALTLPVPMDGEQLTPSYALVTASGARGTLSTSSSEILAVPDELLIEGDRHRVNLTASRQGSLRSVITVARDPAAIVTELPPRLAVTATRGSAIAIAWSGAPAGDHGLFLFESRVTWIVQTTQAWLAANGQASDGSWSPPSLEVVPGWDPAWNLGAGPHLWALGISGQRDDDGVTVTTHTELSGQL
jgi:hypothetical protein